MKKALILLSLLALCLSTNVFAEQVLSFGIITYNAPLSSQHKHEKFIRHLEEATGYSFTLFTIRNDEELLSAFRSGRIDLSWVGTLQYMKYRYQLYASPVAKPVRYGRTYYRGLIFAHADSQMQSVLDLKGKTVAFVDKESEAGYIFPALMLADKGLYPSNGYYARFLRGHDNVVYNVFQKKYDAGAVFDSAIDVYLNDKQKEHIKILAETKDIPYDPFVVSKRVPAATAMEIKKALLGLDDVLILKELGIERFAPASDAEYSPYSPARFELIEKQGQVKE